MSGFFDAKYWQWRWRWRKTVLRRFAQCSLHSPTRLHNYVKGLGPQEKVRKDKRWSEISFNHVMWLVLDWRLWSCSHVQLKCVIRKCPLSSHSLRSAPLYSRCLRCNATRWTVISCKKVN
jgi:hypothetical protein